MADGVEQAFEEHRTDAIELVIRARPRDVGGHTVRRTLPSMRRRLVGPFIFFDHSGPVDVPVGQGMDVRPHPHIALATITYLFEGAVFHRDSLGTAQVIHPGDVNWMVAGRGIVHSERTPLEARRAGHRMHGLQAWVALRKEEEECEPRFVHHPASALPVVERPGIWIRLISGDAFGMQAPTPTTAPTLYADVKIAAGAVLEIPDDHEERAIYIVSGVVDHAGERFGDGTMVVLRRGARFAFRAVEDARLMILGGAPIDGERFMWWNFVSSSKERIERAKRDWKEQRFPIVPGDEVDFIPLPES